MLMTNLKHLGKEYDLKNALKENENVMICCGRMGPMCIPVYRIMEKIEQHYNAMCRRRFGKNLQVWLKAGMAGWSLQYSLPVKAPESLMQSRFPKKKGLLARKMLMKTIINY